MTATYQDILRAQAIVDDDEIDLLNPRWTFSRVADWLRPRLGLSAADAIEVAGTLRRRAEQAELARRQYEAHMDGAAVRRGR